MRKKESHRVMTLWGILTKLMLELMDIQRKEEKISDNAIRPSFKRATRRNVDHLSVAICALSQAIYHLHAVYKPYYAKKAMKQASKTGKESL